MRYVILLLFAALASCGSGATSPPSDGESRTSALPPETPLRPATPEPVAARGEWQHDDGRLRFVDADSRKAVMELACRPRALLVRLPGVVPIGSEERLSFGGGGDVETLVADSTSDEPVVEASGMLPDPTRLRALLAAGPGASYGATAVGPLVPVPAAMADAFVTACGKAGT